MRKEKKKKNEKNDHPIKRNILGRYFQILELGQIRDLHDQLRHHRRLLRHARQSRRTIIEREERQGGRSLTSSESLPASFPLESMNFESASTVRSP